MKTLVFNADEVRLLLKVAKAGHGFYTPVSEFLEEFKDTPEEEVLPELEVERYIYEDVIEMIEDYLCDDTLSEEDFPNEKDEAELRDLLEKLG